jgi:hypothetical protein
MKKTSSISVETFAFFFKPYIRVLFDWQRMERECWPIDLSVVSDLATLSSWYVPWNINGEGALVKYDAPGARPVPLSHVPTMFPQFDEERRELIHKLSQSFTEADQPVQLILPVYHLYDDRCLILDGNHRAAAVVMSGAPFKLMAFAIHGPLDGHIVPELQYWGSTYKGTLRQE